MLLGFSEQIVQLFVSREFLLDALPHLARHTVLAIKGCPLDEVYFCLQNKLPYPSWDHCNRFPLTPPVKYLFPFIVNRPCVFTPELRRIPYVNGRITDRPQYSVSDCRALQYINIALPNDIPTWAHLPTHPWEVGDYLIPEDQVPLQHVKIEMTKLEVQNFTDRLSWPIGRELQFRNYLYSTPTYYSAKNLTWDLVLAGYRGSISITACFRCEQSREDGSGWSQSHGTGGEYFVDLFLAFDLRKHDRLSGAKADPWFTNANDGNYIHSA